jgi:hypothetical protein
MKKLQTICAAALLVLAFGVPALADDGIMGMGDKPPQPPTTSSTTANTTEQTTGNSTDSLTVTEAATVIEAAVIYVVRGLVGLG